MAEENKIPESTPVVLHGTDPKGNSVPVQLSSGAVRVRTAPEKARMTLAQVLLGATDTEVFTAQGNYRDCQIVISNNDSSNRTFQLHLVQAGGSSSDTNLISTKGMTLTAAGPAFSMWDFGLRNGQAIRGLCSSANKVTVHLDGIPE